MKKIRPYIAAWAVIILGVVALNGAHHIKSPVAVHWICYTLGYVLITLPAFYQWLRFFKKAEKNIPETSAGK